MFCRIFGVIMDEELEEEENIIDDLLFAGMI
jgi:hypothetical protein